MNTIRFIQIPLTAVLLTALLHLSALGADIAVIQSAGLLPYNQALFGFETVISADIPAAGPKSVRAHSLTVHNLAAAENPLQVRREIMAAKPDLLLVIGSSSLVLVKDLTTLPIIYLLVPFPELSVENRNNITGIQLRLSAAEQLTSLRQNLPGIKNIGLLYNPEQNSDFVSEAQDFAHRNNLSLTALPVQSDSEVPGELARMADKVELFWMLPDRTVLTPRTIDYIFLFSLENRLPVFTFSEKYLNMGAVLSVSFDPIDMGKQAGELALKILNTGEPVPSQPEQIRTIIIHKNEAAARMLGLKFTGNDKK